MKFPAVTIAICFTSGVAIGLWPVAANRAASRGFYFGEFAAAFLLIAAAIFLLSRQYFRAATPLLLAGCQSVSPTTHRNSRSTRFCYPDAGTAFSSSCRVFRCIIALAHNAAALRRPLDRIPAPPAWLIIAFFASSLLLAITLQTSSLPSRWIKRTKFSASRRCGENVRARYSLRIQF